MLGKYTTNTYRKLFLRTKQIVFLSYFTIWGTLFSSIFSNFGTNWAILKIQSAKLVRISPGLTKYPLLSIPVGIPTKSRYTDTTGHTAKGDHRIYFWVACSKRTSIFQRFWQQFCKIIVDSTFWLNPQTVYWAWVSKLSLLVPMTNDQVFKSTLLAVTS